MSDELDWELSDMFDSGLFAFPVYEQNAARRVVRYLLKRGVPDEEVASAIQGSTVDLHAWLNRRGKPMFGEWAMAWMNETRDLHVTMVQHGRPIVHRNGSLNDSDSSFSRGSSSDDSDGGSDYFRSRPEADDDSLSSSAFSAFTGSTLDFHSDVLSSGGAPGRPAVSTTDSFTSVRSWRDTRTVAMSRSGVVEGTVHNMSIVTHSTDSGNVSDLCSCRSKSSSSQKDINVKVICLTEVASMTSSSSQVDDLTQPPPPVTTTKVDCRCKLAHYIRRHKVSAI